MDMPGCVYPVIDKEKKERRNNMVMQIAKWISDFLILGVAGVIWLGLIGGVFLLLAHIIDRAREW